VFGALTSPRRPRQTWRQWIWRWVATAVAALAQLVAMSLCVLVLKKI